MRELTLEERVHNAAAATDCEAVKARHAYYHARADGTGEWGNIWSHDKNACWGHFFGRMRGFDQIWYGSVGYYDKKAFRHWMEIFDIYPEIAGKDPRPIMEAAVHSLCNDIIEVAEDGKTARAYYITPGIIHSRLNPDKRKFAALFWEVYGSDFIEEDGVWKYLHEQVQGIAGCGLDCENWAVERYKFLKHPELEPPHEGDDPPYIAEPVTGYTSYNMIDPPNNWVEAPELYATLDNDNTYAPLI